MHPITRIITKGVGRRAARPAAAFLLRRNPWGLALVAIAPTALAVGKAVWDAWSDDDEDLDDDAVEGRTA